jgi:tripartite-type tricarboxylate transporter receptor subunit TctC
LDWKKIIWFKDIFLGDMFMINKFSLRFFFIFAISILGIAWAQEYPVKPIKMIVPYPAGGTTDALARLVSIKLAARWGQPVIVENRAGANGNIGAEFVWRSPPDGYTLMFTSPGTMTTNKSLYGNIGYEPETFTPVSLFAASSNVLIMRPSLAVENLSQLIAYVKNRPDEINYASQGAGSTSHLTAEYFKTAAGVKAAHVPFKGSAPAIMELLSGRVDIMFVELSSVLRYIKAGNVKILAVCSDKRNQLFPDIPAMSEVLPGFASSTWFALAAPPKMPPAIASKLSLAMVEISKQPDVMKRFEELSLDAVGSTASELAQFTKQETERWDRVIKIAGIKME